MGLVLNALPDHQAQIASLERELRVRIERISELEEQLRAEQRKSAAIEAGALELRQLLAPLYKGLQMIFGQLDTMGVTANGAAAPNDSRREVWDSWKQKLGGLTAQAIEVLLLHGPMNQTQLRIQLKCASRSVTNIVGALNKAGLIDKDKRGGKISLKRL
jgi:hypothetical protein